MKTNAAIVQEFRDKFGCCDGKDKSATCQCRAELKFLRTHLNAKDELMREAYERGLSKAYEIVGHIHVIARSAYHKNSWDAGVHDALFLATGNIVDEIKAARTSNKVEKLTEHAIEKYGKTLTDLGAHDKNEDL